MDVEEAEAVSAVKAKVGEQTGIPVNQIRLILGEVVLVDACKLSDYSITEDSVLQVVRSNTVKVRFCFLTPSEYEMVDVELTKTSAELKDDILKHFNFSAPARVHLLFWRGEELGGARTLEELGVQDDDAFVLCNGGMSTPMPVQIENGPITMLSVPGPVAVDHFFEIARFKLGIDPDMYRLEQFGTVIEKSSAAFSPCPVQLRRLDGV